MITHQELIPLTTGLITESGPKFNSIVENSHRYNTVQSQILNKLESDFKEIETLSEKWHDVRNIFEFKNSYEKERFEAENRTKDLIETQLKLVIAMQQKLVNIKHLENKGILQMTGQKLKHELENFLKQTHKDLRMHAYNLADEIKNYMNKEYKRLTEQLQT